MANPQIGIDISGFQADNASQGDWLFVCVKATEGHAVVNPRLRAQWANIGPGTLRGLYHYARPLMGRGADQANAFADAALTLSPPFRPGVDFWQLDCEQQGNDGISGTTWQVFVRDFYAQAARRLGRRGFVYRGEFFNRTELDALGLPWWAPDYGPDNGEDHGLPAGIVAVIHQFSSKPMDVNRVANPILWAAVMADPLPAPPVKVLPQSGGTVTDMANAKSAVISCAPVVPALHLFAAEFNAGAPVAGCQVSMHGPAPKGVVAASVDDWWPGTIGATPRCQVHGNLVVVTVYAPNWTPGMALPQVHVTAELA